VRRLILQHWAGEIPEIVHLSQENVSNYAMRVGADYQLLRGYPFDDRLSAPCQKIHMLAVEFDGYDVVVMLDADMFVVKGLQEDVFDLSGIGMHHPKAHRRVLRVLPHLISPTAPFWGGAIYRLERDLRLRLRAEMDFDELRQFKTRTESEDEGIMHRLATRAGIPAEGAYIGYRWCYGNFEPHPERAAIIHMRHTLRNRRNHPADGRDKLANYYHLRDQGVLA
jgi:hypothetical protein